MQNSEGLLCHEEINGKFCALQMFAELTQKIALTNICFYWPSEAEMQCTPLAYSVKRGKHPVCCECARKR